MRRASAILTCILAAAAMNCCEDSTMAPSPDGYSDAEKAGILRTYAPRLWFRTDEAYFPSSVEWAYSNLKRVLIDGNYCWEYLACVLTTGPTGPISKGVFYSEGYE